MRSKMRATHYIALPIIVSVIISLAIYHIGTLVIGMMLMYEKIKGFNGIYLNTMNGFGILCGSVITSKLYHIKNPLVLVAGAFIEMLMIYTESIVIFEGYLDRPLNFILVGIIVTGIAITLSSRHKCKYINKRNKNW